MKQIIWLKKQFINYPPREYKTTTTFLSIISDKIDYSNSITKASTIDKVK